MKRGKLSAKMLLLFVSVVWLPFLGCGEGEPAKSGEENKRQGNETAADKIFEETKVIIRQIDPLSLDVGQRILEIKTRSREQRETLLNQLNSIEKSIVESHDQYVNYPTAGRIGIFEKGLSSDNIEKLVKSFANNLYSLTQEGEGGGNRVETIIQKDGTTSYRTVSGRRSQMITTKGMTDEFDRAVAQAQEIQAEIKIFLDKIIQPRKELIEFYPQLNEFVSASKTKEVQRDTIEKVINSSEVVKDVISHIHRPFDHLDDTQKIFEKLIYLLDKCYDYSEFAKSLERISAEIEIKKKEWSKIWDDLVALSEIGEKSYKIASPAIKDIGAKHTGLTYVRGVTHKIEGKEYWVDNKIVTIPTEYQDLFVKPLGSTGSPNKKRIEGWFKFVKNTTGANALGGAINVEVYTVDSEYAENKRKALGKQAKYKLLIEALDYYKNKNNTLQSAENMEQFVNAMKSLVEASKE